MKMIIALFVLLAVSVDGKYHCGRDRALLCPNGDCNLQTGVCDNCDSGYEGYNCGVVTAEKAHADCSPNPCKNGGTCWKASGEGAVTMCLCTERWTGDTCTERRYDLSCTYAGDGSMSMIIRPQGVVSGKIFLKGTTDPACVFSDTPPQLLTLSHLDSTCGAATVDGTEIKREVLILFEDNRISSQDELVTFICGETPTVEVSGDNGIIVTVLDSSFLAVTKSLAPLTEDMDLTLTSGGTSVGTVTMGTLITLEVELTGAGTDKFDGVRLETCMAGTHEDPTDGDYEGSYFIEDYCPSTDLDDVMSPTITYDGTAISFQFLAFKFMDYDSLFIRCSVHPCEDAADCSPVDCSGDSKRRKRREAGTQVESLQRSINVTDPLAIATINQQLNSNTPCYQTWEMTATVVALAVALVIVLLICIILIVKVIVSRKSDKPMSYRADLSETSSTAHFPNLPTIISNKC